MYSVNKVLLIGNIGSDPEVKNTQNNEKIVLLSVATSEHWKDKATGEKVDKVQWHKVVVFDQGLADVCEKYVHKGSKVFVEGQLQTRKWTDKEGKENYSTEIVLQKYKGQLILLDKKEGQNETGMQPKAGNNWVTKPPERGSQYNTSAALFKKRAELKWDSPDTDGFDF